METWLAQSVLSKKEVGMAKFIQSKILIVAVSKFKKFLLKIQKEENCGVIFFIKFLKFFSSNVHFVSSNRKENLKW